MRNRSIGIPFQVDLHGIGIISVFDGAAKLETKQSRSEHLVKECWNGVCYELLVLCGMD